MFSLSKSPSRSGRDSPFLHFCQAAAVRRADQCPASLDNPVGPSLRKVCSLPSGSGVLIGRAHCIYRSTPRRAFTREGPLFFSPKLTQRARVGFCFFSCLPSFMGTISVSPFLVLLLPFLPPFIVTNSPFSALLRISFRSSDRFPHFFSFLPFLVQPNPRSFL